MPSTLFHNKTNTYRHLIDVSIYFFKWDVGESAWGNVSQKFSRVPQGVYFANMVIFMY